MTGKIFKTFNFIQAYWIVVVLISNPLFGQEVKTCKLLDSKTKEPVPYASVSAGSFFTYSNMDGSFPTLELPDTIIQIRRLGYQSMRIEKDNLSSILLLEAKPYILSQVEISANPNIFEVGYTHYKTTGTADMGRETGLGVFIESPKRNSKIVNVIAETLKNQKGDVYRIYFFKVNIDGEPRDLLFTKEYTSHTNRNTLKINVEAANLSIPDDGILVAINWIKNVKKHQGKSIVQIKLTHEVLESNSYIFYFRNNSGQKIFGKLDSGALELLLNYKIGLEMRPEFTGE